MRPLAAKLRIEGFDECRLDLPFGPIFISAPDQGEKGDKEDPAPPFDRKRCARPVVLAFCDFGHAAL